MRRSVVIERCQSLWDKNVVGAGGGFMCFEGRPAKLWLVLMLLSHFTRGAVYRI